MPLSKYASALQTALTAHSTEYSPLTVRTGLIDSDKTKFKATLLEFRKHPPSDAKKLTKTDEVLTSYHSAVSTKTMAANLFKLLQETYDKCNRKILSDVDSETLDGSGYDAAAIKKTQLAQRTVVNLLADVIDKVKIQLIDTISTRLPLTEHELEQLITYLTGAASASSFWQMGQKYFNSTPNLSAAYDKWLGTHKEDPLLKIDVKRPVPSQAPASSEESEYFKQLDEALIVLGMTYVDPETGITWGIKPVDSLEIDEKDSEQNGLSPSASGTASSRSPVQIDEHEEPGAQTVGVDSNSSGGPALNPVQEVADSEVSPSTHVLLSDPAHEQSDSNSNAVQEVEVSAVSSGASTNALQEQSGPNKIAGPRVPFRPEPPKVPRPVAIPAASASELPSEENTGTEDVAPVPSKPTKPPIPSTRSTTQSQTSKGNQGKEDLKKSQ